MKASSLPATALPADAIARLAAGVGEAAGAPVELERPTDPAHGDYATNAALRLAASKRRAPRDLAAEIAEKATSLPAVERAELAGPGFVNFFLEPSWFREALGEILDAGEKFGADTGAARRRIQVEMVSANPTGPLTVASARNGAYGDSVARLLAFAGHEVEREYYYNDAGAQMELFRRSVEARRRGEEPPADGYQGEYLADLAQLEVDPVPEMLRRIERTLERFRVHFDSWVLQSELGRHLDEVLRSVETYERDGALWVPASRYGDEKDRVVVRSDGTPTYFAADIVYVRDKLSRGFDTCIYVLGADHHGYVARLKAAAALVGEDPARLEVLLYQLVHLTRGGEQAKMSKRRGDVVILDEFLDEVGVDAARWYLVDRGPDQAIEIDIDLARARTQKNPVYYVQYAHARIAGILRNEPAGSRGSWVENGRLEPAERELIKRLVEFPTIVAEATERCGPHALPTYAIRVADDFHRFYHDHRVLGSESETFRLGLCRATQTVLARCLALVGVEAPERM